MFKLDKNLHHAYCFEGDVDYITDLLLNFLEKDFKIKGNPDFWMGEYDRFGINDGRKINDFQLRKADKKIIVIKTNFITREAQNSLLKMFEEPTANTHFFIIVPSKEILLPTLQSRLNIEKIEAPASDEGLAKKFIEAEQKDRLDMVKELIDEKDKMGAINLMNQIEKILAENKEMKVEEIVFFERLNKLRGYLNDRAPSMKMILEHLALITPNK
jgi:DNA polymerase-3 subunit delta'